ncbi:MAG: hypothetical protein JW953_13170, partial [Anaerolineae bacterium]|nr:hypothetical protein [Anaerolineae bacterium]
MANQKLLKKWHFLSRLARLGLGLGLLIIVAAGLWFIPAAHAATYVVDRFDDNAGATACTAALNDCSLRGAISAANNNPGADTITLPAGTYTLSGSGDDTNGQGDLDIFANPGGGNLTINGAGASVTIINGPTGNDRIFHIQAPGDTVNISGVTIQNGNAPGYGGGIAISNGALNIANSTIYSNTTAMGGGAIAISGDSALNIVNTTIYSNAATGDHDGGGIYNLSRTVTITGSAIYTNTARDGAGIENNDGTVLITNTTIDDNEASQGGGGIVNWSGAVTIANSAFSNNRAGDGGGGILNETSGTLNIANSALSNNYTTRFGGGIS